MKKWLLYFLFCTLHNIAYGMEITHIDSKLLLRTPKELQTKVANNMIDELIKKAKKDPHHITLHPNIIYENTDQYRSSKKIIHSVITSNGEKFIFADETRIQILNAHSGQLELKIHFDKTFLHYLYYNQPRSSYDRYNNHIKKIIVSPNNTKIAALSKYAAKVWDIETGNLNCSIGEHSFWSGYKSKFSPYGFEFSHDGQNFIAVEKRNDNITPQLRVWDVATGKNTATLAEHYPRNCATFHPHTAIIASDNDVNEIIIWDLQSNTTQTIPNGHAGNTLNLSYSKDGTKLLSSSGVIKIWNTKNYQCLRIIIPDSPISCIEFSPDAYFILATLNGRTEKYDTQFGVTVHTFNTAGPAHYSHDGKKIIFPGTISKIYDAESHKQLYTFSEPTQSVHSISHKKIICASSDKINIYQLPNIKKTIEWFKHNLSLHQAFIICLLNKELPHLFKLNESDKKDLIQIPPHTLKSVVAEEILKKQDIEFSHNSIYTNKKSST